MHSYVPVDLLPPNGDRASSGTVQTTEIRIFHIKLELAINDCSARFRRSDSIIQDEGWHLLKFLIALI